MSAGYIYIGGYEPAPGVLFLKAGKTKQPKVRVKAYGTMVPGGLSFMRAAKVDNAHSAETELMARLKAIDGVEPVGGEWFRCPTLMRLAALDQLHEIGHEVIQVHTHCPARFGERTRWKRRKRRGQ